MLVKRINNNEYIKNRYRTDPEFADRVRKSSRESAKRKLFEYREALYDVLGGAYCHCSEPDCWHISGSCTVKDKRILHFDHINGGGQIDKHRIGGGIAYLRYYYENQEEAKTNLQVLCSNCNWIKKLKYENNGRPRKLTSKILKSKHVC